MPGQLFVFYIGALSVAPLAFAEIDLGTAYAIWSGMGVALVTTIRWPECAIAGPARTPAACVGACTLG